MSEPRRNLVFCRAGESSLHRAWIGDPAARSYDVWLDCYCDPALWKGQPAKVTDGRGTTKWPRIAALLGGEAAAEFAAYDAVWFPDDDVDICAAEVEEFFAIFHRHRLALAQPALTARSFWNHEITLRNKRFVLRRTNFVEVMAPAFSRGALQVCAWTFSLSSRSGWAIDLVWTRALADAPGAMGIVDATPMTHTRPLGGAGGYRLAEATDEMRELASRYGVALPFEYLHYGGIPRRHGGGEGRPLSPGLPFATRFVAGVPTSQRFRKLFWKRMARSLWRAAPAADPLGPRLA